MPELITTIVIAALAALLAVLAIWRTGDWSLAVRSIGFGVIAVAAYFLGIIGLAVSGVVGVVSYLQTTIWTPAMTNAAVAAGVGLVLMVVARYLPRSRKPDQVAATKQVPGAASAPPLPRAKQPPAKTSDPEDDEIEALLRARGIS